MGFMATLTALLYGALLIYLGGWFTDRWIGDFSLLLFLLTLVTFAYWVAERLHFAPPTGRRRRPKRGVPSWRARASARSIRPSTTRRGRRSWRSHGGSTGRPGCSR